jgi:hypothetical protein
MPLSIDPFYLDLLKMFLSALLGGMVGAALKIGADEIGYSRARSHAAQEKLQVYAKPLYRACDELKFRLVLVQGALSSRDRQQRREDLEPLGWWPPGDSSSIKWYNEDGQYITSTAYLIAVLSSWIKLFEDDVVFLHFGKVSATTQFFDLLEDLKSGLSDYGSTLYYNYFSGIGDQLIVKGKNRPMSIAEFSYSLYQDKLFRDYFEQLFQFLRGVSQEKYNLNVTEAIRALQAVMEFLIVNGAIPEMGRSFRGMEGSAAAEQDRGLEPAA